MNIQDFVWTHMFGSPVYLPGSGIVGSYDNSSFDLLSNFQALLRHFTIPPAGQEGLL